MEAGSVSPRFNAMAVRLQLSVTQSRSGDPLRDPSRITVILADHHHACRRNLRLLLEGEADVEVIAEAPDIPALLMHVSVRAPEVLVLNPSAQGGSDIATIGRLRADLPDTQIVVLTMEESSAFADRALAAGAIGLVLKHKADEELPTAVRRAARGQSYVSPRGAAGLRVAPVWALSATGGEPGAHHRAPIPGFQG